MVSAPRDPRAVVVLTTTALISGGKSLDFLELQSYFQEAWAGAKTPGLRHIGGEG